MTPVSSVRPSAGLCGRTPSRPRSLRPGGGSDGRSPRSVGRRRPPSGGPSGSRGPHCRRGRRAPPGRRRRAAPTRSRRFGRASARTTLARPPAAPDPLRSAPRALQGRARSPRTPGCRSPRAHVRSRQQDEREGQQSGLDLHQTGPPAAIPTYPALLDPFTARRGGRHRILPARPPRNSGQSAHDMPRSTLRRPALRGIPLRPAIGSSRERGSSP